MNMCPFYKKHPWGKCKNELIFKLEFHILNFPTNIITNQTVVLSVIYTTLYRN